MSALSSIEDAIASHFTSGHSSTPGLGLTISNIDIGKVLEIVNAIVQAAPAIVAGIQSTEPYVKAISDMIANGGKPTDEQWATLKALLDANSQTLADAEAEAQSELDAANGSNGGPASDSGSSGGSGASLSNEGGH